MLRISRMLVATLVVLLAQTIQAQTNVPPIPLPQPFTPIIDQANVIDAQTRTRLGAIYLGLKERADIEFAVVTVPTTGDKDIYDFALALSRGWGIGSKEGEKNGFLLVVAVNDKKYFTMVSRHLEADLTDGIVGQIQRERLVPQFRQKNYSGGIYDTVQSYAATLAQKRGFSIEGIDQSYAVQEGRRSNRGSRGSAPGSTLGAGCTVIIVIIVLLVIFSSSRRGGGGSGCLTAFLLGNLLGGSGRRGGGWGDSGSGWGGGGFGGGGGGGGGGFGGGFGGGGDFGGGGAGGSW